MKSWKGNDLSGRWLITWKVDGVQAIVTKKGVFSRRGKPLYNLYHLEVGVYEIFKDNWETSVSLVRTQNGPPVPVQYAYWLEPKPDARLIAAYVTNPSAAIIFRFMKDALKQGYEGLVLWQGREQLKVKQSDTYDVRILSWIPGDGKHKGRMGALVTPKGKVGTGFTDEQREMDWSKHIGETIEVECTQLTPSGKFRHARFKRLRFDK